jgi:UPF0271 protein
VKTIDLNADVGEGYDDAPMFEVVSSVNVACGAHAGDDETMARAVALAARLGVAVGAHPGYPDRASMGRADLDMTTDELRESLFAQIHALGAHASREGTGIVHVKPHGALYNSSARDAMLAATVASVCMEIHPALRLTGLAGSLSIDAARAVGVPAISEAFADRAYRADGSLAPRSEPGALIADPAAAASQAVALARGDAVETVDGTMLTVRAETICCHGDTPGAVEIARAVRAALERDGFAIAPPA